jgi:imidazolonepropionase-like amidohydrolase
MVEARQGNAVSEAIKLFRDEFQVPTILIGADDAARAPELVANKRVAIAAGPALVQNIDRKPANLPQILANHQVPFGFQSQATTGAQLLPLAVQYAVHRGLSRDDAMMGLTASPARFLSLDSQIGTLAVGKDADLVVLSGSPFEPATHVLAVMIDGQWVYEKEDR